MVLLVCYDRMNFSPSTQYSIEDTTSNNMISYDDMMYLMFIFISFDSLEAGWRYWCKNTRH